MTTHSTAQLIGGRSHQCDATATYTHEGRRAYVLLDGIGSDEDVQSWTRTTARRLARAAARNGALKGVQQIHAARAEEVAEQGPYGPDLPMAVAVVAVTEPGQPLQIAWCGDARAYLLPAPTSPARRLTTDHNMRQVLIDMDLKPGPYSRNRVTSYLGDTVVTAPLGSVTATATGRLILASDGAYEPLEDADIEISDYLTGRPQKAARTLVEAAVTHGGQRADNATALVADLG